MKFTAAQIAQILQGTVDGDATIEVYQLAKIEEGTLGSLTFLANPKYTPYIYTTQASLVIVNKEFKPEAPIQATLIRVDDAYQAFSTLLEYYDQQKKQGAGIEKTVLQGENVTIGENTYLGHYVVLGNNVSIGKNVSIRAHVVVEDNVHIGNDTIINQNTVIHSDTHIGDFCVINAGCIIGSDGFGFAPKEDGSYKKIPQTGNVIIEDHVDVGANSTIDRATLGSTRIGRGVKLDNQIQVAHNVEIGDHTVIAAQSGVAGSSKVGKNCVIGGQVGIIGHLTVGDRVKIQGQSGVTSNIKSDTSLYGTPAINFKDYLKSYVFFKRFPAIMQRIEALEKKNNE